MSSIPLSYASKHQQRTLLGHPPGLFILFLVEMWERFSYYGMRGLLVLYLHAEMTGQNPGRGWSKETADNLAGWYMGMAYFLPVFGGFVADKLIGAHRSMLVGGFLIALGHIVLAISGIGHLAEDRMGMAIFVGGLALITIGTGHFKPNVSVMVGDLYSKDDPRRDSAFTIFYMGINLGAFICAFICGTLGEKVGWHWGFGSAAVGMLLGLITYMIARPFYLRHIGDPPAGRGKYAWLFLLGAIVVSAAFAAIYFLHVLTWLGGAFDHLTSSGRGAKVWHVVEWIIGIAILSAAIWFVAIQSPGEKGPTLCILIFIIFNAVFWLAYEQAGTSLNHFAKDSTNRHIFRWEMPATWFQSVNPLLIIVLSPVFAGIWSALGRRKLNPGQPMKIAIALLLLGLGYIIMVLGARGATPQHRASMFWLFAMFVPYTMGELCISPTGLAFLTRAAPVRFVSFLMGLWFISVAIADKVGGQLAGQIDKIQSGDINMFWYKWIHFHDQADFFMLFVVTSLGAGLLVLILTPFLNWLLATKKAQGQV